jgi:hypothetical protein
MPKPSAHFNIWSADPTAALIDRRGVVRKTCSGVNEKRLAKLQKMIEKLLNEPAPTS